MNLRVASALSSFAFAVFGAMPINASAQSVADSRNRIAVAEIHTGPNEVELRATVRRTVRSMMDYTTWPTDRKKRTLCVVGPSRFGDNLDRLELANRSQARTEARSAKANDFTKCDAIYLGQIDMVSMRAATEAVRNTPVLTIAESDPQCRSRAMFCLVFGEETISFKLNIDSISRSKVRVDPRVLRLAEED